MKIRLIDRREDWIDYCDLLGHSGKRVVQLPEHAYSLILLLAFD